MFTAEEARESCLFVFEGRRRPTRRAVHTLAMSRGISPPPTHTNMPSFEAAAPFAFSSRAAFLASARSGRGTCFGRRRNEAPLGRMTDDGAVYHANVSRAGAQTLSRFQDQGNDPHVETSLAEMGRHDSAQRAGRQSLWRRYNVERQHWNPRRGWISAHL